MASNDTLKVAEPNPIPNALHQSPYDIKPSQVLESDERLSVDIPDKEIAHIIDSQEKATPLKTKEQEMQIIDHAAKTEGVSLKEAPILNSMGQIAIRVKLTWENVTVIPKEDIQDGCCSGPKTDNSSTTQGKAPKLILNNVCGSVKPCQFLSIIGASGAGKTTLLNYLSNKMFPIDLHASGKTTINGIDRENLDFYKFTAFVQQDDILFETLTVEEILLFAASLKCSPDPEIREQRVREMLSDLELTQIKDLRIGNLTGTTGPQLSRGEKKKLSIALELITNPALVFMDEPTTSMDAFTAESIIQIINKLKNKGKTIIATIHQPNAEIFKQMDMLMLLSFGNVIFFGKNTDAIPYFDSFLPKKCPKNQNPAEYLMTMMNDTSDKMSKEEKLMLLTNKYKESEMSKTYLDPGKNLTDFVQCDVESLKYTASTSSQFCILYKRAWINYARNKSNSLMRYIIQIYFALIACALYWDLGKTSQIAFTSRIGALYYVSNGIIMSALQMSILVFPEERAVFMREQASSLYDVAPYFFAKILAELPFSIIDPLILSLITYWAIGFNTMDSSKYFVHLFTLMAGGMVSGAYSLFLGSFISDREVLIVLIPILNIPLSLLSGWFVRLDYSMTILWPIQWISVFKYAFNGVLRNELQGNDDVAVKSTVSFFNKMTNQTQFMNVTVSADDLLNRMEAKLEIWECFVAQAGLYIGFTILALIGLKISSRRV